MTIPKIKILFSKYDGREKISIEALGELAQDSSFSKFLLPCFIRASSELPKAAKNGQTIFGSFKKTLLVKIMTCMPVKSWVSIKYKQRHNANGQNKQYRGTT